MDQTHGKTSADSSIRALFMELFHMPSFYWQSPNESLDPVADVESDAESHFDYCCALCGLSYWTANWAHGHNPEPILEYDQRVCASCNQYYVIPARLNLFSPEDLTALRERARTLNGQMNC